LGGVTTRATAVLAAEDGEGEQEESLEVTWACTCGKPPRDCGAFGPAPWTK
jgi:hypothetical protein